VNPAPPPSSSDSDSRYESNSRRHHFTRGTTPRIQGYRCHRGTVDGEQPSVGYGGGHHHGRAADISTTPPAELAEQDVQGASPDHAQTAPPEDDAQGATQRVRREEAGHDDHHLFWLQVSSSSAGAEPASDPMILEAGLLGIVSNRGAAADPAPDEPPEVNTSSGPVPDAMHTERAAPE